MRVIAAALARRGIDALSPQAGMAGVISQARHGLAQAMVAGPAEADAARLARFTRHRNDAGFGREPVHVREALAHVAQLGQDLRCADATGPWERHEDLPVGQGRDEAFDLLRQGADSLDQRLQNCHHRENDLRRSIHGLRACQARRSGPKPGDQLGRAVSPAVTLLEAEGPQPSLVEPCGRSRTWVLAQEGQGDGLREVREDLRSAGPERLQQTVELIAHDHTRSHQLVARTHEHAQRLNGIGLGVNACQR